MKTVKFATGIILSASLATAPQVALAGEAKDLEAVEFELLSSELESENGRAAILSRMKQSARAACRKNSYTSKVRYTRSCGSDMVEQWIAAIGNASLSAQAYPGSVQIALADQ